MPNKIQAHDVFDFFGIHRELEVVDAAFGAFSTSVSALLVQLGARWKELNGEVKNFEKVMASVTASSKSTKAMADMTKDIDALIEKVKALEGAQKSVPATNKLAEDSIKALKKEVKAIQDDYEGMTKAQREAAKASGDMQQKVAGLSKVINEEATVLGKAKRAVDLAAGSYAALNARNIELKKALQQTGGAIDASTGKWAKSSKEVKGLGISISAAVSEIQRNDKALKSLDSSLGNHQRSVGNYKSALGGLGSQLTGLAATYLSLQGLIQGVTALIDNSKEIARYTISIKSATGSNAEFVESISFLDSLADRYGLNIKALGNGFKLLAGATKGTALEGAKTRKMFADMVASAAALQLPMEDVEGVMRAFGQMLSKDTVQMEELKGQLGDRLPGALRIAADAMNMTTAQLTKQIEQAKVLSADLVPALAASYAEIYGEQARDNINQITGATERLSNQTSLFFAVFADKSGITDTFTAISNGIADLMRDLRSAVTSGSWSDFWNMINPLNQDDTTRRKYQVEAKAKRRVDDFGQLPVDEMKTRYELEKQNLELLQERVDLLGTEGVAAQQAIDNLREQDLVLRGMKKSLAEARRELRAENALPDKPGAPGKKPKKPTGNPAADELAGMQARLDINQILFDKQLIQEEEYQKNVRDIKVRFFKEAADKQTDINKEQKYISDGAEAESKYRKYVTEELEKHRKLIHDIKTEEMTGHRKITKSATDPFLAAKEQIKNNLIDTTMGRAWEDDQKKINKSVEEGLSLFERVGNEIDELVKGYKKLDKEKKKAFKWDRREVEEWVGAIGDAATGAGNIWANYSEARYDTIQRSYDREMELAGDNEDAQKAIAKRQAQEERKARREEAIRQKAMAVFQAYLNMYLALTESTIAPWKIVTATAALASAVSIRIPAFGRGKSKYDNYEGTALVGEAGQEIVEQDGKSALYTGPTLIKVKKGTIVHTNRETQEILSRQQVDWTGSIRANMEGSNAISPQHTNITKINVGPEVRNEIKQGFENIMATMIDEQGRRIEKDKWNSVAKNNRKSPFV